MKSLFHPEYLSYTEEAKVISDNFIQSIEPFFKDQVKNGFSPRELVHIFINDIMAIEAEIVIINALKNRAKNKK